MRLFYLLAVGAYLRAWRDPAGGTVARRWYWSSVVFFVLALLSKAMAMTLPVTLLILDVYPLRRLTRGTDGWMRATARNLVHEKLPYLALSIASAATAMHALVRADVLTATTALTWPQRIAISCYDLVFYLWKTAVPVGLSPIYELPEHLDPWAAPFLPSIIAVAGLTVAAALSRRQAAAGEGAQRARFGIGKRGRVRRGYGTLQRGHSPRPEVSRDPQQLRGGARQAGRGRSCHRAVRGSPAARSGRSGSAQEPRRGSAGAGQAPGGDARVPGRGSAEAGQAPGGDS